MRWRILKLRQAAYCPFVYTQKDCAACSDPYCPRENASKQGIYALYAVDCLETAEHRRVRGVCLILDK